MPEYQTLSFTSAFEEYCEAIWELKEDDADVIQARIAERLHVSRPAVSGDDQANAGRASCRSTARPSTSRPTAGTWPSRWSGHRLAERLLTDILGLSWADAHVEAGKWEHVIRSRWSGPSTGCSTTPPPVPTANSIPAPANAAPAAVAPGDLPVGSAFTVTRIPEELEFTPGLLEFLEDAAVQPGHRVWSPCRPTRRRRWRSAAAVSARGVRHRPDPGHGRRTAPVSASA